MERIATTSLRRTCRSALLSSPSSSSRTCIASRICAARSRCLNSSSSSTPTTPFPRSPPITKGPRTRTGVGMREYATDASSIQGTIGKGEKGIGDEVDRGRVALVAPDHLNEKEAEIFGRLAEFFEPVELEVQDISGGCGSMYGISITSEKFRGLNMLKQQRLVNGVLGEDIKSWHGVQLKTNVP